MKKFVWIVLLIALFALVIFLWPTEDSLPNWIQWNEREICHEEKNGSLEILLTDRSVSVISGTTAVWTSDEDVQIQDILWCDIDRDDMSELLLLCWKQGRYGNSRPFWIGEDDASWSQHIYIYDWTENEMRPIWMASDIGVDAVSWYFDEELRLVITDMDGMETAWDWVSWGVTGIALGEKKELTFAAVGDNLIHSQIYDYAFRHFDGNFDDLFAYVREELDQYDVTSINQETIYVDKPEQYSSYPEFGTPVQVGEAVIAAGFDIVSCATNHALDQGTEGIDLTVSLYDQADVICAGIQLTTDAEYRPYEIYESKDMRIAVLSYTQITNGHKLPEETPYILHTLFDEEQVKQDLVQAEGDADATIVYVHWGTEYSTLPDEEQLRWAKIFADHGVEVVIGTHPHVIQPYEWVEGSNGHRALVYYSLGNFISAQTEESCRYGALAHFTISKMNGRYAVSDYGMKTLVTTVNNGHYTTTLVES